MTAVFSSDDTRYYYDNVEGIYEWAICIGTSTVPDDKAEPWYFTRYAILVSKLPRDAKVQMWFSLGVLQTPLRLKLITLCSHPTMK